MNSCERGQVLAFFAVLLPIILLPLSAYAVDAAFVTTRAAALQASTAQAAEAAAQQVDVTAFRARSVLRVDAPLARAVAIRAISESVPEALVVSVIVVGTLVTVISVEDIRLPFNFVPVAAIKLHARASARLVSGYDSPSSRLPLPTNTF
jgi:hypothetical protein